MLQERIERALDFAVRYGQIDGDHHKMWVIDQMVRALTGCPMVRRTENDCNGRRYTFDHQAEGEDYVALTAPGEDEGEWDIGIPP
jgi:hypothetical protein